MAQNTFHVALYVSDLDAAIERYRKLLGQEPAKVRHDYAKFEISLRQAKPGEGGRGCRPSLGNLSVGPCG